MTGAIVAMDAYLQRLLPPLVRRAVPAGNDCLDLERVAPKNEAPGLGIKVPEDSELRHVMSEGCRCHVHVDVDID